MKTIDEYMKFPYPVELIPDTDEGGFTVAIPSLPGCLSVGKTVEDAYRNIEDAKHECVMHLQGGIPHVEKQKASSGDNCCSDPERAGIDL